MNSGEETGLNRVCEILARIELQPSKSMGQNFLIDRNLAKWIVAQLRMKPQDTVVEIGSGLGALTAYIASQDLAGLYLIEKERRLAEYLREVYVSEEGTPTHIIADDAAKTDVRGFFPLQPVKLIGNLPYSCGSEILRRFLTPPSPVCAAVVMLQSEVINRITAAPGDKIYGPLSLRMQAHWEVVRLKKTLPPQAFYPRPTVDSAVAVFRKRRPGWARPFDHRWFDELVGRGFGQRRKQLRKLLPVKRDAWEDIVGTLQINPLARAEELSLETWLELCRLTDPHPLKNNPQNPHEVFDVVNEDDEVTCQASRAEVHANGLLHRAVHVLVFNKRGEVFLQKRSHLKDSHPGGWDSSCSGHLDSGEDYETAVWRELKEELGLKPKEVQLVTKIPPSENTGWEHVGLYTCKGRKKMRYPCSEIETGGYFPVHVVDDWIERRSEDFASGFVECWILWKNQISELPVR